MDTRSSPLQKRTPPRLARLLQVISVFTCFVLPCGIFASVLASLSLGVQKRVLVEAAAGVLVFLLGVLAHGAWRASRGSVWHIVLFATSLIAWIAAVVLGSQHYEALVPYYDMISMATYIEVDPLEGRSGALMQDAGRVLFTLNSRVDRSKGIAFKNTDLYCAAPVVAERPHGQHRGQVVSYDFWAVGMNCCDNSGSNFTCGEVADEKAYAALRVMDASQNGYYRLAVQQAEAAYGIKVSHPLFFTWMRDPWAALSAPWDAVCHQLLVQIMSFCTAQLFVVSLVAFAVAARAKADD